MKEISLVITGKCTYSRLQNKEKAFSLLNVRLHDIEKRNQSSGM